jgi:D-alanyl-D-alanine carboxypeptidase/D-alanyl-D-alanine-endopeptidase (penicillin-binding protein 4)
MLICLLSLVSVAGGGPAWAGYDPLQMDGYLRRLHRAEPRFEARLERVIRDMLGTPYFDGPLGEGPAGTHDTDPLVDFSRADCVTSVEQAIAAASAGNYMEMFDHLQRIRYRGGVIDFEPRNHFMITDWIANNTFCKPLTEELGLATEAVTRTISRKGFFERVKAPGLGLDTPDRSVTLRYIPSALAEEAEKAIPEPSLIVFIGKKVDWLFALHCGFFLRDERGVGRLYEASSKLGFMAELDLSDYVREQGDRYLGFTVYRVTDPAFTPTH